MVRIYSKKRKELVGIIEHIINNKGEIWELPIVEVKQREGFSMFTSAIPVDASYILFRRIPREYNDPKGSKKALKEKKINNIEKSMRGNHRFTSPTSLVANILCEERRWGCKLSVCQNNNSIKYLTINLLAIKERLYKAKVDEDGFIIDEDRLTLGYLIDGHHRIEGIYQSDEEGFELPLTLYFDLPREDMPEIFVDINYYQEKPSQIQNLGIKALSGTLSSTEQKAKEIMLLLNTEPWSILKDRIKDLDSNRPKGRLRPYISSKLFYKLLYQQMLKHIKESIQFTNQAHLINDYFMAWSNVFREAWADEKKHVLVKSMGVQIMMRLFSQIHSNAIIENQGNIPDFNVYKSVIEKALGGGQLLKIDEGNDSIKMPINWTSDFYGVYSSGKGINTIVNALTQHITNKLYV
ncbi:DGQHR domain protein [Priestia megaterium Q3]|uniref:DGQHR domain protein n=1 Tax=Priestia megaterium Q3 TaxID=1452722 RepID=A0A806TJS3_PRIMG|nr:DGQHR domain-containing protein [Priestia megaterium]AKP78621.1 DGQHR domain protein [Priestia megaterium Q3]